MNNIFAGFIAIFAVLFFSVDGNWTSYFQMHSVIIVIGGTAAVLVFSTPGDVLRSLGSHILGLMKQEDRTATYRDALLSLADSRQSPLPKSHKLVEYAQELWSQGIDPDLFIVLLSQKRKEIDARSADVVHAIKSLAKYPPTLGMTGTVIGMIKLFSTLDSNKSSVGSALSTAMTATFLGLVLANIFIAPIADRLHIRHVAHQRVLDNCYEILLLINQGEPSALIREELNERSAA
jgi:chemotaxis protein MotA